MAKEKKSFFERLTGTVRMDETRNGEMKVPQDDGRGVVAWMDEEEKDGELTVDVYQTNDMIVIKAMIAGVRPEDLDIAITRDMVTIKGSR